MRHKILKKIERLRYYLQLLEEYGPECEKKFHKDPLYEGALLHYLYLVSDGSIALAEMVLKERNLSGAQNYYEAIDRLGEEGVLPREFAYDFAKIAGFRNFLAHDYEKIDSIKICNQALAKLEEVETYLDYVAEYLHRS